MANWTEAEQKAIKAHEALKSQYLELKKKEESSARRRIMDYLYETGGGATLAELEADLKATRGKAWTPTDDEPINIDMLVTGGVNPAEALEKAMRAAGGFFVVPWEVRAEAAKNATLKREGDKIFLKCHNGIDWGAKLVVADKAYENAKKEHGSIAFDPEKLDALESEAKSLQAQIDALGFFKGKQKKPLKERLTQVQSEIFKLRAAKKRKEELEKQLPVLEGDLNKARSEIKRNC